MKNKISFTSVLKSKASVSSRMMSGSSSQHSNNNDSQQSRYQQQHQHQRLIDIYQQYESYPEQDYTLDFSCMSKNVRTRNSSLSNMMSKSNKNVSEDPQMSLQMWIESQKKGSYDSFSNNGGGNSNGGSISSNSRFAQQHQQKGFNHNQTLIHQEQQQQLCPPSIANNRRSRSNYSSNNQATSTSNKNIYYHQQQQNQQQHMQSSSSLQSEDQQQQQQYYQHQQQQQLYYQQQQQQQRYDQPQQLDSNSNNGFISGKWSKKAPINQNKPQLFAQQNNNLNNELQSSSHNNIEQSSKSTPQDYLSSQMIRSKSHYPSQLQDRDYDKLKEEFQRLKSQKITELCMQARKTIKRDKLREIVNKALENIYQDIEHMAEKMVDQKRRDTQKNIGMPTTKKLSHNDQQRSQSMLISGGGYQVQQEEGYQQQQHQSSQLIQTDREQEQRRQQQMRNMIKGYISGIQEAKTQGNLIRSKQHHQQQGVINNKDCLRENVSNNSNSRFMTSLPAVEHQSQQEQSHEQHSFNNNINYQQNTFNNELMSNFNNKTSQNESNQFSSDNNPMDCVGYSFANNSNNMTLGCEHSFNRDLLQGNANSNSGLFYHYDNNNNESAFNKQQYMVKPEVYQPEPQSLYEQQQQCQQQTIEQQYQQQSNNDLQQQRISLPNIEQVKSESGEFPHQQQSHLNDEVQSSKQIQTQIRNKQLLQQMDCQNSNNNIKNIESVHYEPPASERKYYGGYFQFNEVNNNNMMQNNNSRKDLFKNFQQQQSQQSFNQQQQLVPIKPLTEEKVSNYSSNSSKQQRFVSKTFNSYLSGEMRSEYGLAIKDVNGNKQSVAGSNSASMAIAMKVSPISVYSPPTINKQPTPTTYQSLSMSLNQSINNTNSLLQKGTSPKSSSQHTLQSKNKFSISSPMNKIDEMISQEEQQLMMKLDKKNVNTENIVIVNEFPTISVGNSYNSHSHKLQSPPYAVSSSITGGENMMHNKDNNSSMNNNKVSIFNPSNSNHQYACSESISINNNNSINNGNFNKNSIQPGLKSSMDYGTNNNRVVITNQSSQHPQQQSIHNSNSNLFEIKPLMMSPKYQTEYLTTSTSKLAESIQISQLSYMMMPSSPKQHQQQKQSITITYGSNNRMSPNTTNNIPTPTITSGRNFLQSLHEKQSIEIQLSPSPNHHHTKHSPSSGSSNCNAKQSFVAETFRPLRQIVASNSNNSITNIYTTTNQCSNLNNNKETAINGSNSSKGRSNSHTKLSITKITLKSSSDKNHATSPKVISLTVNNLQSQKQSPINQFIVNSNNDAKQNVFQKLTIKESINNNNMSLRNSESFANNKQQQYNNYVDLGLKENNNTLNSSIQNGGNTNDDWKKQSMNQQKLKESLSAKPSSISTTQRKQPLIKLSKNFTNATQQLQQQSNFNIKKSIGQSIRTKVHQPGMMITSSRNNMNTEYGIRQSFNKYGVKQSIGNDSDMDFDLELD